MRHKHADKIKIWVEHTELELETALPGCEWLDWSPYVCQQEIAFGVIFTREFDERIDWRFAIPKDGDGKKVKPGNQYKIKNNIIATVTSISQDEAKILLEDKETIYTCGFWEVPLLRSIELLNCPLCDSAVDVKEERSHEQGADRIFYFVSCSNKDCQIRSKGESCKETSADQWNKMVRNCKGD